MNKFESKGITIIGVSKDSVKSHKNFEEKQNLSITLLSDTEREVIEAYDVWKEKRIMEKYSWELFALPMLLMNKEL